MSGGCEEEAKKAPGGGRFPFWSRISNCKQIRTLTESLDLFPHRKKTVYMSSISLLYYNYYPLTQGCPNRIGIVLGLSKTGFWHSSSK